MKWPRRKPAESNIEAEATETKRVCPQCGTPVSTHASTCAMCGYDFIAALEAEEKEQVALKEQAAQRPWVAIGVGGGFAVVALLIVALIIRNRSDAIARLTPSVTPTFTITATATLTPSPTPTPPFTPTPVPPREHIVQPNDTLCYIADLFQVGCNDLLTFNNLPEGALLQVNQVILIPPPTPTPTLTSTPLTATALISPTPSQLIYVVQSGDTVSTIAERFGVAVQAVLDANNITDADLIREGDQLIIPLGAVATSTSEPGTPTPLPGYGAVTLLLPLDNSSFTGNSKTILLQWLSSGILRNDEVYRVTVNQVGASIRYGPIFIKATALHLPNEIFPDPSDSSRTFEWHVSIVRQTGVGSDGNPVYAIISPQVTRRFIWLPAAPTATLTPAPTP